MKLNYQNRQVYIRFHSKTKLTLDLTLPYTIKFNTLYILDCEMSQSIKV